MYVKALISPGYGIPLLVTAKVVKCLEYGKLQLGAQHASFLTNKAIFTLYQCEVYQ